MQFAIKVSLYTNMDSLFYFAPSVYAVMRLLYPASCLLKQSVSASHKLTRLFVKTSDAASMQLFSDCCRTRRFFLNFIILGVTLCLMKLGFAMRRVRQGCSILVVFELLCSTTCMQDQGAENSFFASKILTVPVTMNGLAWH